MRRNPPLRCPRCSSFAKRCAISATTEWAKEKVSDLDGIIAACLGLHLEAVTEKPVAQPGENLTVQVEAINRSPVEVKLQVGAGAFEQGCHAGRKDARA